MRPDLGPIMRRCRAVMALWLAVGPILALSACKSLLPAGVDEEKSSSAPMTPSFGVKASKTPASNAIADRCAQPPKDKACCEALTPSCNECRRQVDAEQVEWAALCLRPASALADCKKPPPVIDCCVEATDDCRQCREEALNRLLTWKEACGDADAVPCDKRPGVEMCCQALIPSCAACQERNLRVRQSWEQRCQKKP